MSEDRFTLDVLKKAMDAMIKSKIKPLVCKKCGKSFYVAYIPSQVVISEDHEECQHEFVSSKS